VSSNSGHGDLLELGMGHCLEVGSHTNAAVDPALVAPYGGDPMGVWGETDPEELVDWWRRLAMEKNEWLALGRREAAAMEAMSWRRSMAALLDLVGQSLP
jgi:hypothetical protein